MRKEGYTMSVEGKDQVIEEEVVEDEILDNQAEEIVENADNSDGEEKAEEDDPEISQDDVEDDEEDRVVSIGEPEVDPEMEETEGEHQEAPKWVKTVRKANRKYEAENKKLKKQIEQMNKPVEETVNLGIKPTIASCGYDEVLYEKELLAYDTKKRKVESQVVEKQHVVEEQNKQWQVRKDVYASSRKEHNFKDFQDTEELVADTFSTAQQSIIVQGADDAALLVYAIGKNPKKMAELAKITNIVDFAFKVAKVEAQLKVTKRKAPKPETRIKRGKAGGVSGNTDATLQKLRDKADKTGDRSEVAAYIRKMRETQNG